MGTNLSQVFISNALTVLTGSTFNSSDAGADDVGVWNLSAATPTYLTTSTPLYRQGVDMDRETDDNTTDVVEVANPLWLVNRFQIVQRGTPNFIATPIITAANVKSVIYENYTESVRHQIVTGTLAANTQYNVKFIIRTTPTAYLNYTNTNTGLVDLSNANIAFPLGSFNTTNHKAINIGAIGADSTAAGAKLVSNIQESNILNALFTASNSAGAVTIAARHAGVIFEMIVENLTTNAILANGTTTVFSPGVGNDWQVIGEELQCRSRYGNFNRMYFPQDFTTYGTANYAYDKITITYATNWPTSTGIAPAGATNQAVIYYTNEGTDPGTTSSVEFDDIFRYTAGTNKSYIWF